MRLRQRRPRLPALPQIQVVSLIDVMVFILIFYMLISQFGNPSLDVTLPTSSTARQNPERSVTVVIDADGAVSLDGQALAWDELTPRLQQEAQGIKLVRIRADQRTPYDDVVHAFDAVRAAGLEQVALETAAASAAPPAAPAGKTVSEPGGVGAQ
jgi:biopolymer transport protein ExbD